MQQDDRLGNPECKFPIGICYGDRDFHGSDNGAEEIVKKNKYFKSGKSQLFQIRDSGHNIFFDQPDELAHIMIGFFNGTIKGKFQHTPKRHNLKKS